MNCPVKKTNKILSIVCGCLSFGICFTLNAAQADAQAGRDPFLQRPTVVAPPPRPKTTSSVVTSSGGTPKVTIVKAVPAAVAVPSIEQRIASYKELRLRSAQLGIPAPKPTTVLTLDEVQIIGIFHTPRGYAAMVEATPIKLSYTIYPGEKFFNGQLVAIEDNRLVFRRVTQFNNGKSVIAAESKTLRQQTMQEILTPTIDKAAVEPKDSTNAPQSATTNPTLSVPAISGINPSNAVQMADNGLNNAANSDSDALPLMMPKTQPKAVKSSKGNRIEPRKNSPKSKNVKSKPVQDGANDVQNMNAEQPETSVVNESNEPKVPAKPKAKTPKAAAKNAKSKPAPKVVTPKPSASDAETVEAPKVSAPKPSVKKAKAKPVVIKKAKAAGDAGESVPMDITSNGVN